MSKNEVIGKWAPIIEHTVGKINISLRDLICEYCEWYSTIKDPNNYYPLVDKISKIRESIMYCDRIEIIGNFFNPCTGKIEMKLSDGRFISTEDDSWEIISDDQILKMFEIEFLKVTHPKLVRDYSINEILKPKINDLE